jgi:exopolysaccharide biosynthesis polyprenyl glycosylphosphotransferase
LSKQREVVKYIAADYLASALAWTLFYIYRRLVVEPAKFGYSLPVKFDENYYIAVIVIPLYWIAIYWLIGTYRNIYRKSRVRELGQTLTISFLGTIFLFFLLLLDDVVSSYAAYRATFFTLFLLQFGLLFIFRFILLSDLKVKMKKRIIGFNTLLIGSNQKALDLYYELENEKFSQGYRFEGFLTIEAEPHSELINSLPNMGSYTRIADAVKESRAEEVILAVESSEHHLINEIISLLDECDVTVKVIPDMYDIITGSVKMNYIFGTALIEIRPEIMPAWQKNLQRILDIGFSSLVLAVFSPVYLALYCGIKLSSPGPAFYKQERIGINGKPFFIHKFRTMYVDAEKHGPALSSKEDPRITPFGKILRQYRIDEIPQFWNVLKGDMSLVGPRPERQFFIDQIVKVAPHYKHLLKVRPGITSWGQIKFGYAENVGQMVERMKFDILYVENMTLAMDFKILFYTILIILQGRGK